MLVQGKDVEITYRTIDQLRDSVHDLANQFLPDGCRPFVDVFTRVRARRELRVLIDTAVKPLGRVSPLQVIELLFYGNPRLIRKVAGIYGQGASPEQARQMRAAA
ncbi:MAG: hypothetical protein HY682_00065 [Chloroflexi bacterium]|nr:hypothetical protein [Chloroflexota bacterium]